MSNINYDPAPFYSKSTGIEVAVEPAAVEVAVEPVAPVEEKLVRARNKDGTFIGDDPTTEVDEAWTTVKSTTKK